jgi:hypothetical protein
MNIRITWFVSEKRRGPRTMVTSDRVVTVWAGADHIGNHWRVACCYIILIMKYYYCGHTE